MKMLLAWKLLPNLRKGPPRYALRRKVIGPRIRQRRRELKISLRELAEQVGVTASFLSQVERDLVSPSLHSLKAIAAALEVPMFYFLLDGPGGGHVVRCDQRKRLSLPNPNLNYELLTPDVDRQMLLFLGRYEPGGSSEALPAKQPVEECIFVLQGCLEIRLADGTYILDAGDSICFEGANLRRITACGDEELVYLSVTTPPAF